MSTHAKLSPSAAHRWMRCPGSVSLCAKFEDTSSEFAAEGSAAHFLAEHCYASKSNPMDYQGYWVQDDDIYEDADNTKGEGGFIIRVDAEMCAHVQDYLSYIDELQGDTFVEVKVDLTKYIPDSFGHVDCLIINSKNSEIHVIDLKYGKGIKVSAKRNEQLRLYALGAVEYLVFLGLLYPKDFNDSFWTVTTHVYQPRIDNISNEVLKLSELIAWGNEEVKKAAEECIKGETFNPGIKQCQFCKAKGSCKALAKQNLETAKLEFSQGTDKKDYFDPSILTNQELAEIHPKLKLISTWAKAVEEEIKNQLIEGNDIPGLKVVHGRSIRKWVDVEQAEALLKSKSSLKIDDIYSKKIISPTQAEKVIKTKFKHSRKVLDEVNQLVFKPPGKPTVVKESDKREAIVNINAKEEFSKIQEQ